MIYFVYMGSLLAFLLFVMRARRARCDFPVPGTWDMTFCLMVGGFVGARLLHVGFEDWEFYRGHPLHIFYFWYGGFVYYGGVAGAVLASLIFLHYQPRLLKQKSAYDEWLAWANFFTPVLSLGYALGRIGCQIAGCCFGKMCSLPWAINGRHPAPLYLSFLEFCILGVIIFAERFRGSLVQRNLFVTWILLNSLARFLIEPIRDDFRGPALAGWSISSWLSFGCVIASALLLFRSAFSKADRKII